MPTEIKLERGFAIGDKVAVKLPGSKEDAYYEIVGRDTLLYVTSHSSVSAGAESNYESVSGLNPPADQLYQIYKLKLVKGNVKVYLKQPAPTSRWGTNYAPESGYLTPYCDELNLNIFIVQDYPPSVKFENDTDISITPVLRWFGWKYQIKKLDYIPETFTRIQIGGLGE